MKKLDKWRRQNPFKPFKELFAESVEAKLRGGKPHSSLGGNLFKGEYGVSGAPYFQKIVDLGLKPDDTCVDYGCGTLRLGIHAIRYLEKGAYWGFDISDFLLQEGRKLIGEHLWIEKNPHLRVISDESVAEVAAARPAMLFSAKVLIHVHPDELSQYFKNVVTIIGSSGQAIISGKWSDTETIHYASLSWAHSISTIEDIVKVHGGSVEILSEKVLKRIDGNAKLGALRIIKNRDIEP